MLHLLSGAVPSGRPTRKRALHCGAVCLIQQISLPLSLSLFLSVFLLNSIAALRDLAAASHGRKTQLPAFALIRFKQPTMANTHCTHCGEEAVKYCGGCNVARYCGRECQAEDW